MIVTLLCLFYIKYWSSFCISLKKKRNKLLVMLVTLLGKSEDKHLPNFTHLLCALAFMRHSVWTGVTVCKEVRDMKKQWKGLSTLLQKVLFSPPACFLDISYHKTYLEGTCQCSYSQNLNIRQYNS